MILDISATKNHKPIDDSLFPFHVGVIHDLTLQVQVNLKSAEGVI